MIRISVRVHPGASQNRVTPGQDGYLEVSVRARPVENKANEALVEVLAEHLRLPRGDVRLVRGQRGRLKVVELPLASTDELSTRLRRGG